MSFNLIISPRAALRIDDVADYLFDEWGVACMTDFLEKLEACFNCLIENPFIYQTYFDSPSIRRCVVTPHNILYYTLVGDDIVILAFEDTRQNPNNLKLLR